MNKNNKYVYFHVNPLKNNIFYVGIGNGRRAYNKSSRNDSWINEVKEYNYVVDIIETDLTWEEACEREIFYIKKIGRRDLGKGNLVNMTDGGEGNVNLSKETKNKISNSKKGKQIGVRLIDLTGNVFGRLTVLSRAENFGRRTAWICNCECGNKNIIIRAEGLKQGTKSCGCIKKEAKNNPKNKPVIQLEKGTGKILSVFNSVSTASKLTNIKTQKLWRGFIDGTKYYGGYDWKFINKEEFNKYGEFHNISIHKYLIPDKSKNIHKLINEH